MFSWCYLSSHARPRNLFFNHGCSKPWKIDGQSKPKTWVEHEGDWWKTLTYCHGWKTWVFGLFRVWFVGDIRTRVVKETDHINFERDTDICHTRKCKLDWKDTLCHCGHVESIPEMTWSLHQSRSFASMAVRRFETSTSKHRLTKCLQPGSTEVAFFFGEGGIVWC